MTLASNQLFLEYLKTAMICYVQNGPYKISQRIIKNTQTDNEKPRITVIRDDSSGNIGDNENNDNFQFYGT